MRGKAITGQISVSTVGITPAHAGKSIGSEVSISYNRDHPRACGEKL